jgi:hypothetical protein
MVCEELLVSSVEDGGIQTSAEWSRNDERMTLSTKTTVVSLKVPKRCELQRAQKIVLSSLYRFMLLKKDLKQGGGAKFFPFIYRFFQRIPNRLDFYIPVHHFAIDT